MEYYLLHQLHNQQYNHEYEMLSRGSQLYAGSLHMVQIILDSALCKDNEHYKVLSVSGEIAVKSKKYKTDCVYV